MGNKMNLKENIILAYRNYFSSQHIIEADYNLTANFVKNERVPSLKRIALSKISISICKNFLIKISNVDTNLKLNYLEILRIEWNKSYDKEILQKINEFSLPKSCSEELKVMHLTMSSHIYKYLESLEQLKLSINPNRLKIYLNNLHCSMQGTVDYVRTISALLENPNISEFEKYNLACSYCLSSKVKILMKSITKEQMKQCIHDNELHLSLFWTLNITNKESWFRIVVKRYEEIPAQYDNIYLYLLEWAIIRENEVAVHFIWENFTNKWIKENITWFIGNIFEMKFANVNILCYLLSQMKSSQDIEYVIKYYGLKILPCLAQNYRWREYFLKTSEYIITSYSLMWDFRHLLQIISFSERKNDKDYKKIINELNRTKNVQNLFQYNTILPILPYLSLTRPTNIVIFDKLLTIDNFIQWKSFLYSVYGMKLIVILINYGKINILEMFLQEIFANEEEENKKFHDNLFKNKGFEICYFAILSSEFDMLDKFLKYFGHHTSNFKKDLPFKKKGKIIGDILIDCNLYYFHYTKDSVDQFLGWCFDNNEIDIARCKTIIFSQENDLYINSSLAILSQIYYLIENNDPDCTESYLKWAFLTEENIYHFKWNVAFNYIIQEPNLDKFEMFVNKHFSENKIQFLYDEIKYSGEILVIEELLMRYNFSQANSLLNCTNIFPDIDAVLNYKEFVMFNNGVNIFYEWSCLDWSEDIKYLIEWFNPTRRSAILFLKKIVCLTTKISQVQTYEEVPWLVKERVEKYLYQLLRYCTNAV